MKVHTTHTCTHLTGSSKWVVAIQEVKVGRKREGKGLWIDRTTVSPEVLSWHCILKDFSFTEWLGEYTRQGPSERSPKHSFNMGEKAEA